MGGVEDKNCLHRNNNVTTKKGCLNVNDRNKCKRSFYIDETGQTMACRVHNKPSMTPCHYKSRKIKGKKLAKCTTLPFIITNPNGFNDQKVNSLLSTIHGEVLDEKYKNKEFEDYVNSKLATIRSNTPKSGIIRSTQKLKETTSKPSTSKPTTQISISNMTDKELEDYVKSKLATIRSGGKKKTKRNKRNKKYKKRTTKH